ncbi:hypothetical protein HMPREF1624_04800 [Sporothrix schenckii ATCC 58251]|uniref:DNA polymerase kappa n=1 Tax=Sporothrix schenckii (strain ATCC 58251 / de Perez 2211183) TaxID=1391915 RepID=U7PYP9_SPOS1|nr:hypothetical protein HMPREF1624_04800 [Sporothrix schenckii ATCC 58251]
MGSAQALDLQATPEDSGEASAANRSKETFCLADDHEDDNDPAQLTIQPNDSNHPSTHETLKYSLLGPSLLKAGQESVDQSKVSDVIYHASKGSKYFDREEERDKLLSLKINQILSKKAQLERLDLARDLRLVDTLLSQLENGRDLSQFIVHVDCDAFYASVELLDRPELADVPFAVGRGVLSTCNYVARKFGCRSGMAGFVAKKLCPQLVLLKPDYTKYNAKAQDIRQILAEYDPRFESASIDEAYLNITQYCSSNNTLPAAAVEKLRQEVAEKTKITVSAGIAANTRLAKICSNMNKPNGQFILPNDRDAILDFMKMLPCRKVNGVGRVFERELAALGINTCGDCYLGLGRTRVQPAEEYERKSVGTESTFASISDIGQLRQKLRWTAEELEKDLKRAACKGRTLVLKIKLHTFEVYTRQVVLPRALQQANDLYGYALPMLSKLEQDIPNMTARLMGLRCTHLMSTKRPDALAFFGIKSPGNTETSSNQNPDNRIEREEIREPIDDDREWEVWPEAESDGGGILKPGSRDCKGGSVAPPQLQGPPLESELLISQPPAEPAVPEPRPHGKTITANPTSSSSGWGPLSEKKELWSCPVCLRGQPADEKQFNSHIDNCLSRRTILEVVQQSSSAPSLEKKSVGAKADKKRSRPAAAAESPNDHRQKKISFKGA